MVEVWNTMIARLGKFKVSKERVRQGLCGRDDIGAEHLAIGDCLKCG